MEMLKNISGDLKSIHSRMNQFESSVNTHQKALGDRIDQLETRLEKKLSDRVAQLIDRRLTTELNRLRKDVDDRVGDFRTEVTKDLEDMSKTFETLQESMVSKERSGTSGNSCNLV